MKFHEINSDTHNIIDAYDHDSIRIKKNTYQKGIIIFPEKIISRPSLVSYEDLKNDNLKEIFEYNPELILIGSNYKNKIIDKNIPAITLEASSVSSWEKYSKNNMGIETFGKSAPFKEVYSYFNLTSTKIVELTKKIIKK